MRETPALSSYQLALAFLHSFSFVAGPAPEQARAPPNPHLLCLVECVWSGVHRGNSTFRIFE